MADTSPTPEDFGRDLAGDLALCEQYGADECPWEEDDFGGKARAGWPAAIRLALWYRSEVDRLQALLPGR